MGDGPPMRRKLRQTRQLLSDRFTEWRINLAAGPVDAKDFPQIVVRWPRDYRSPLSYTWLDPVRGALARACHLETSDVPHEHDFEACVRIEVVIDGECHDVAIDFADQSRVDEPLAERCLLYFKMQYRNEGYGLPNVLPAGYVMADRRGYLELPRLRRLRDRQDFRHRVCGRFALFARRQKSEYRRQALDRLRDAGYSLFVPPYKTVSRREYFDEIARSKICIDLPGNGDLCFRLVEYMSVGACIIGPRHMNRLIVPLEDRKHIVFAEPDLSNLVELCEYYLQHDDEREAIARNSREYFDLYLHRDQVVRYMLASCVERVTEPVVVPEAPLPELEIVPQPEAVPELVGVGVDD